MRHHAGWTVVFKVRQESVSKITGVHPEREALGEEVSYSTRAMLARFETQAEAEAAAGVALAAWKSHDVLVREAEARLRQAERVRENAWLAALRATQTPAADES